MKSGVTLLLLAASISMGAWGYDAYTSCTRPYRTSKARPEPPCDFKQQSWCTIPGSAYPWHAVRRFVHENQGLMKRMYGDERHISVLRAEIESNDVEYSNEWKFREDVRRRYSTTTPPTEHMTSPYFRPASTTAAPQKSTSSNSSHIQNPKPITPNPDDSTVTTNNMTEPENITDPVTSTTPCISTESTSDLPTATTTDTTSEESTTTTRQTEKVPATMLFQDAKNEPADNTNQGTPVKLRGVNACPVKEEVVAPFWANNTRGEVLALLNLYPFEQYVHWEKCTFEHKQMFCREGCRCEQQYRLHRLLAYDPNNECRGIFSDWFKFPSCCVCRCYDLPVEFQITSRSPRSWNLHNSAPPDWYKLMNAG